MLVDYFLLDDKDSRNFKVYLQNPKGARNHPFSTNTEYSSEKITGRDGKVLFDQWYTPTEAELSCFCLYSTDNDFLELEKMKSWVGKVGLRKLVLSYELQRYRNVVITNISDITDYENQGCMFTINIKALAPFSFSHFMTTDIESGLEYGTFNYDSGILYAEEYSDMYVNTNIVSGDVFTIYNGGNYIARPNFIFDGDATTLLVEQYSDIALSDKIGEFSYGAFSGTLEVNSLVSNTYLDETLTTSIEGDYISIDGDDTGDKIIDGYLIRASENYITLDENASSVDDFYNGKTIYVKNGLNTYVREILDYDGAFKIAVIDSDLPKKLDSNWFYSILDLDKGKTYFKVTGTGFSSLDLTVDFRFAYI